VEPQPCHQHRCIIPQAVNTV